MDYSAKKTITATFVCLDNHPPLPSKFHFITLSPHPCKLVCVIWLWPYTVLHTNNIIFVIMWCCNHVNRPFYMSFLHVHLMFLNYERSWQLLCTIYCSLIENFKFFFFKRGAPHIKKRCLMLTPPSTLHLLFLILW